MSDPNRLGNGNNGDSENNRARSFEINWDDILKRAREFDALRSRGNGDLLDDASDNNVEPLKSSKVNTGDDFEEVDLSSAGNKTTSYSERLSALLGYDNTGRNNPNGAPVTGQPKNPNGAPVTGQPNNPNGAPVTGQPKNPNGAPVTGQPNNPNGVPVTGQPNNPNGVPVTGQPKNPNVLGTKGNKVRGIMERFRKSGIGKLFVGACIVTALTGAFGMTYQNGYKNGAANATAKIESQVNVNTNENQGGETGSDGATKELDETATDSNAEKSAEKLNTNADVRYFGGEVFTDINQEFGGDNTGVDLLDNKNIESTHADPLTNKLAKWVDNEGNVFEAAQASPEANAAFKLEVNGEMNRRIGNIAPLVQEGYVLGYFGEGDNINNANMTQTGYEFSTDSEEYQSKKELIQADYINRVGEKTYKIGLLRKGQHYASIAASRIVNPDGTARPNFYSDDDVDASINGTMYIEEFDTARGINYYDAHPEIKENVLRVLDLIKTGASEDAIQDAMDSWTVIRLPGCMQYGAIRKTPEPTYKVEYKTPEDSSSTHIDISIAPIYPDKPDPKLDDGSGIHKEEDNSSKKIRRIIRGGNHHDDSSIHENDKKKDDDTPDKTPDKPSETPDKPSETPDKPSETPKDNENVLEAKTADVKGADEFDTQKVNTITDQTVEATLGSEQENARMETTGGEVENKVVEEKEVVEEFSKKDEAGVENVDKTLDQVENNENMNTGATEKQSDAEAKMTVEKEKESTEKAPDTSYDLGYASAEWDFSNFGN